MNSFRDDTRRCLRGLVLALLLVGLVPLAGCQPGLRRGGGGLPAGEGIRAIWVTRWDYKSPADIARIMENCRQVGFNTVLFQVRGQGTAHYRSRLEPWAQELGGRDPGFDPLAVACREAHRRGLGLHAWVNVIPGWRGKQPPQDRRQLYHAHPDWFWRDAAGRRQPPGWYVSVNPCYPEVRQYLVAVMQEIATRYPVDGLHLDYVRFPNEWNSSYPEGAKVPDYPRDPRTLALFRQATGKTPAQAPGQWDEWRTAQVTQLVREIRSMLRRARPHVALSAAVGADPTLAQRTHFQDARRWMAERLVDAVFPMNYTTDLALFNQRLQLWSSAPSPVRVVPGISLERRTAATVKQQLACALRQRSDLCVFAYSLLFDRAGADDDRPTTERAELRRSVMPFLRR